MIRHIPILSTIFLSIYLIAFAVFKVSLTGFWNDIIFMVILVLFNIKLLLWNKQLISKLVLPILWLFNVSWLIMVSISLFAHFASPDNHGSFCLKGTIWLEIDDEYYNLYHQPDNCDNEWGNYWVTKSPKFFPFVEKAIENKLIYISIDEFNELEKSTKIRLVKEYIEKK